MSTASAQIYGILSGVSPFKFGGDAKKGMFVDTLQPSKSIGRGTENK